MSTLDNIVTIMRGHVTDLRNESAEHAREATRIDGDMAEPLDVYRAMEAQERELVEQLELLRATMATSADRLAAMKGERDRHEARAQGAADMAVKIEDELKDFAALLVGIVPPEALAATGLMVEPPKEVPRDGNGRVIPPPGELEPPFRPCGNCGGDIYHNRLLGQWEHARDREALCDVEDPDGHYADPNPDAVPLTPVAPAPREPVATPPVPTAPAGELVATHRPDQTMPDVGLNPRRLDPPPGAGHHSHAKPGLGSRITGGFKALLDKPEQAGEQQGDGENGGGQ